MVDCVREKQSEEIMLEVSHIQKHFKNKQVLKDISFTFEKGQCVGILGANGCGKSTLLTILAGVQTPDQGSFVVEGHDLLKENAVRQQVLGYVPQGVPLMDELSAWDNLRLWYPKKELKKELESGVLAMLGIDQFLKTPVSKMSGGMKKRVSIGCSVANHPKILLLDEPSAALDLVCKENIYHYLKDFKANGGTILLITHDPEELSLCDKWYILKNGEMVPYDYRGDFHDLVLNL